MSDTGGYWDDNIWAREDDPNAAELWRDPDLPRKLLYWSGAQGRPQLPELAAAWLAELTEIGLPEPKPGREAPHKQANSQRPTLNPGEGELYSVRIKGHSQVFWLKLDGSLTHHEDGGGYKSIEVLDKPLRTQTAIISLLTALEASPLDAVGNLSEAVSREELLNRLPRLRGFCYILSLLQYYRPTFDELSHEEQLSLIEETSKRVNSFLVASRQLVNFLEYGVPNRDLRPAIEHANRDVEAAVLHDVDGLSASKIAERLGLSTGEKYRIKGGHRTVEKMAERGRKLLEGALGKEGWQKRIEAMKADAKWFRGLSSTQQAIYSQLERENMTEEEARQYIAELGR